MEADDQETTRLAKTKLLSSSNMSQPLESAGNEGSDSTTVTGERLLGRYEILSEIASGAMGRVRKARDIETGTIVAIKDVESFADQDVNEPERLKRHFKLVSNLTHQHICKTRSFELTAASPAPYLIMDFIEGESLKDWMSKSGGKTTRRIALGIIEQLASALDFAHTQPLPADYEVDGRTRQGILHRDLKPANIMVDQNRSHPSGAPWVVIVDFGLATPSQESSIGMSLRVETEFQGAGNRLHMAPEQFNCETLSPATDQWALALIFLELVYGVGAIFPNAPIGQLCSVTKELVRRPDQVSKADWKAVSRSLSPSRKDRYRTCTQLSQCLPKPRLSISSIIAVVVVLSVLGYGAAHFALGYPETGSADRSDEPSREATAAIPPTVGPDEIEKTVGPKAGIEDPGTMGKVDAELEGRGEPEAASNDTTLSAQELIEVLVGERAISSPDDSSKMHYGGTPKQLSDSLKVLARSVWDGSIKPATLERNWRVLSTIQSLRAALERESEGIRELSFALVSKEDPQELADFLGRWELGPKWRDEDGFTLLMAASKTGAPEFLSHLLSNPSQGFGQSINEKSAAGHKSAIYLSVENRNKSSFEVLKHAGADPDQVAGNGRSARSLGTGSGLDSWFN